MGFSIVKDVEKFKNYLTERGAVVLPPTNPWEVVRFRTHNGVSVVYTNKHGHITYTGESAKAYEFFKAKRKWSPPDRKRQSLKAQKQKLAERDGKMCWFHGEKLDYDQLTIEHLLEHSKGGNDHPFNLCLACEECNKAVVGMSITEKMLYRDHVRKNGMPISESGHYDGSNVVPPKNKHIIMEVTPNSENYFAKLFKKARK